MGHSADPDVPGASGGSSFLGALAWMSHPRLRASLLPCSVLVLTEQTCLD